MTSLMVTIFTLHPLDGWEGSRTVLVAPSLVMIYGPRTRLARAILTSSWAAAQDRLLIVRDEGERAWATGAYPALDLLPAWVPDGVSTRNYETVAVVGCALGLIHSREPHVDDIVHALQRDLRVLEIVLRTVRAQRIHVLFVSSVVALASPRRRGWYGGWKMVTEAAMERIVREDVRAGLSVVYPGRLVEETRGWPLGTLLATSYRRLAGIVAEIFASGVSQRRVVGVDARLWLCPRARATLAVASGTVA